MEFLISITGKLFTNAIMKYIENNMKRIKSRLKGLMHPAKDSAEICPQRLMIIPPFRFPMKKAWCF
jgi:hypothetical protein